MDTSTPCHFPNICFPSFKCILWSAEEISCWLSSCIQSSRWIIVNYSNTENHKRFLFSLINQGQTKLLLTRIPFFREVVISSFQCEHCGLVNNSVDPAAPIQEQGKLFTLSVRCPSDLNRRIIMSRHSEIHIPSLDSTFPNSEASMFDHDYNAVFA